MIRDGAPPEWTPLMRLVACEIADDARDPSTADPSPEGTWPWSAIPIEGTLRRGIWRDGLAERCGMSARAISRTLADLATAGYEMREPITDKDGRPVADKRGRLLFTAPGHALRFRVPPLSPRPTPHRSPNLATDEAERSPNMATEDASPVDNTRPHAPISSPYSATVTDQRSPLPATDEAERSPNMATTVAEYGDPISSLSPHKNPPHKNQSPHVSVDGLGALVTGARAPAPRRCEFEECPTPGKPLGSAERVHVGCGLLMRRAQGAETP